MILQRCPLNANVIYCDLGTLLVAKILVYSNLLPDTDIIVFCLQGDRPLDIIVFHLGRVNYIIIPKHKPKNFVLRRCWNAVLYKSFPSDPISGFLSVCLISFHDFSYDFASSVTVLHLNFGLHR
jgi:hypothetical protein